VPAMEVLAEQLATTNAGLDQLDPEDLEARNRDLDDIKRLVRDEQRRLQDALTRRIRADAAARAPHELDQTITAGPLSTDLIRAGAVAAGISEEQAQAAIAAILAQRQAEVGNGLSDAQVERL
jgi:hypothetical protein